MKDFVASIPATHTAVSSGFVEAIIQAQCERHYTGILYLDYPSGESLVLTFLDGVQQNLYRTIEQNVEVVPRQLWPNLLDRPDASIRVLNLPIDALELMRVAYEAPIVKVERRSTSVEELSAVVGKWAQDTFPSIVHLNGNAPDSLYLIGGYSTPVIEALTLTDNQAQFSLCDASFANSFPAGQYQVTRYISDNKYDVWQEYELRFAFHPLMRMLLIRFSQLAGRVLTERLCEQLSAQSKSEGWNISITMNGVVHHQYFESLEEARRAYLQIVRRFNELAGSAIGGGVASGLTHEVLLKLNAYHRSLLQRHIYDYDETEKASGRSS